MQINAMIDKACFQWTLTFMRNPMIVSTSMEGPHRAGRLGAWVRAIASGFARAGAFQHRDETYPVRSRNPRDLPDSQIAQHPEPRVDVQRASITPAWSILLLTNKTSTRLTSIKSTLTEL